MSDQNKTAQLKSQMQTHSSAFKEYNGLHYQKEPPPIDQSEKPKFSMESFLERDEE